VPLPANLKNFVKDRQAALRLGKALFYDMQVGSDGIQACATCHFQAGGDVRSKNQVATQGNRVLERRVGDIKGYFFAPANPDTGLLRRWSILSSLATSSTFRRISADGMPCASSGKPMFFLTFMCG